MTAAEVQRVSASCALFSYSFKAGAAIWAPVKHQQLLNDGDHSGLVQRHRCVATAGGVSATRPGGGQKEGGGGSQMNRLQLMSHFHGRTRQQVFSFFKKKTGCIYSTVSLEQCKC